jgi:Tfp pilus assembly protein FimT
MKTRPNIFSIRRRAGVTLIECLVYVGVFAILLGLGTAAFFFCWDHTRATVFTASRIEAATRAGETWRADIRAATGRISVDTTGAGEVVTIPEAGKNVVYHFANGEVVREVPASSNSRVLLEKVSASDMKSEMRGGVTAWHWEMELDPQAKMPRFPLRYTFEAAQANP